MNTEYVFCEVRTEHVFIRCKAVAWFRQLMAGQLSRNLAFIPEAVRGRFVVGPKWHSVGYFYEHFDLPLSVSFRQCHILIFVLILLIEEGRADEVWELSIRAVLGYRRNLDRKLVRHYWFLNGLITDCIFAA